MEWRATFSGLEGMHEDYLTWSVVGGPLDFQTLSFSKFCYASEYWGCGIRDIK